MPTSRRILPVTVFLLVLAVYLAFPTKVYYWDGVAYSLEIENPGKFRPTLTHPNHLVFGPAGYYWYRSLRAVWPGVRAIQALQVMSSVFGAASAAVLCATLLSLGASAYVALLLALLLAFSATWWKFATDAGAYVPSVFFLVVCAWLLLGTRRPRPALLAAAHTAAMLFHQLAALFFPAAIVGLWIVHSSAGRLVAAAEAGGHAPRNTLPGTRHAAYGTRRGALGATLIYCAITLPITLVCYYYGYYLNERTLNPRRFLAWITFHTPDSRFTFDVLGNTAKTLASHLKLLCGGRLTALEPLGTITRAAVALLLAGLAAALIWKVLRYRSGAGTLMRTAVSSSKSAIRSPGAPGAPQFARRRGSPQSAMCLAWAACYLAFLFFWLPHNTFYRLFYLPALLLLLGFLTERAVGQASTPAGSTRSGQPRAWTPGPLALAVAIVALWNFVFFIHPNSRVSANPPLALAREMKQQWAPGTVIQYATLNSDDWILMYEHPQTRWIPLATPGLDSLRDRVREAQNAGHALWIETTALDLISSTPAGAEWLAAHTRPAATRELVNSRQRIRLARLFP